MAKDFSTALSSSSQPTAAFVALEAMAKKLVGAKLFTLTIVDPVDEGARRVYSNMAAAYPIGGTKPAIENDWSKLVIGKKQTFVANTIESIAKVFPDHELIKSLGCQSVINVPVVVGGRVIGTINCLHKRGFYTKEKVRASEKLKLPGAAVFLLCFALDLSRNGSASGSRLAGC